VNLSVLDGWWAEAYDARREKRNGWGIPPARDEQGDAERDRQDSTTLYETIQDEVIPLYYARDADLGYSPEWVRICKRSMASVLPAFNSERTLHDYLRDYYVPAARQGRLLAADGFRAARELGAWKEKLRTAWPGVALKMVGAPAGEISFAEHLTLEVEVALNGLEPHDVRVECQVRRVLGSELAVPVQGYAENRRPKHGLGYLEGEPVLLTPFTPGDIAEGGRCRYRLELKPPWAGTLHYEVRAVPDHPHLSHPYELGLMRRL
jgi:starch phosphorylase